MIVQHYLHVIIPWFHSGASMRRVTSRCADVMRRGARSGISDKAATVPFARCDSCHVCVADVLQDVR